MVQRRAARYVSNRFQYKYSVKEMLDNLQWRSLQDRRRDARLQMFYKVHNNLIPINFNQFLNLPKRQLRHTHEYSDQIPFSKTDAHRFSYLPIHCVIGILFHLTWYTLLPLLVLELAVARSNTQQSQIFLFFATLSC